MTTRTSSRKNKGGELNTSDLLRRELAQAHTYLEVRIGLCPPDALYRSLPGATIASIAATYAHAVVNEDDYVHNQLAQKTPLYKTPAWTSKLTFPPSVPLDPVWAASFRIDLPSFRDYAQAVYEFSDAYRAWLSDEDLARPVRRRLVSLHDGRPVVEQAPVPMGFDFADMVTLHISEHAGEISALLGVQGLKGSPWG